MQQSDVGADDRVPGQSAGNDDAAMMSLEDAQQKFWDLVEHQRTRALWFMNPVLSIDITGPHAAGILDHIAQRGSRAVWLDVRKLKRWRSQNIK